MLASPSGECCHCSTTTIFSDDFDREDNDSLGSDWDERSGDIDILSNNAYAYPDPSLAICNTVPTRDRVRVTSIITPQTGEGGLVVAYTDDDNYLFAIIDANYGGGFGTPPSYMKLYERFEGSNSEVASIETVHQWAGNYTMRLSYNGSDGLMAEIVTAGIPYPVVELIGTPDEVYTGKKCGLISTVTGTVIWQDFLIESCAQWSPCQTNSLPTTMQIVISGVANDACSSCGTYNGTFVTNQRIWTSGFCLYKAGYLYSFGVGPCQDPSDSDVDTLAACITTSEAGTVLTVTLTIAGPGTDWTLIKWQKTISSVCDKAECKLRG